METTGLSPAYAQNPVSETYSEKQFLTAEAADQVEH
jgi:hypothetical protein